MATLIVMLVIGVLLVVGGLLWGGARAAGGARRRCPSCGRNNVGDANYCAQCGQRLDA
ncbi:MAG: zinc-ribbon domain-containing protein [Planctomycetota bacterium]|nr:MAG: zinc-ribbon domain-containing protein [Planctomycetota bacterium]